MRKMTKKWHKMTSKNQKIWNFQILSDRPDRPIPAIWIGRIVGKSIFRCFPKHWISITKVNICWLSTDFPPYSKFENIRLSTNFCHGKNFCQNFLRKKLIYLLGISCKYLMNRIQTHEDIHKLNVPFSFSTSL